MNLLNTCIFGLHISLKKILYKNARVIILKSRRIFRRRLRQTILLGYNKFKKI